MLRELDLRHRYSKPHETCRIVLTTAVIIVLHGTAIWVDRGARKLVAAGACNQQLGDRPSIV
jgi:hypothetical protein